MRRQALLEEEGKERGNKWVVYCVVVAGVVIGAGIFVGGMITLNPIIHEYFNGTKEIANLYNFYDEKAGENTTAVYFIGASHVAESVYPPEINRILKERGYDNITVYSCYVSSECPLDRIVHLQKLIDSKPELVIYGIAASQISKNELTDDNVLIVQDRLNVRDDALGFYTEDELTLLNGSGTLWDMKRFVRGAVVNKITGGHTSFTIDYSVDPLGGEYARRYIWGSHPNQKTLALLHDPEYSIEYSISNSSRSVRGFNYILDTLEKSGISVAVVDAPINPLTSDKITNTTRDAYYDVLNETGYDWYNFEWSLPEEDFFDGTHPKFSGAMKLAPKWADLIIQEVNRNAIHHS